MTARDWPLRSPYPLQWPDGWPRVAPARRLRAPFRDIGFARERDELLREMRLLRAAGVVITSDLPVRADGLPYANGRANDPGIAVYWRQALRGGRVERVIACDKWTKAAANLRGIAKTIAALRGIERWGSSAIVEQAFAGFAALPAAGPRPWHEVLGVFHAPTRTDLLATARARYRALMLIHHPDRGGSHERAAELNAALAAAEKELS